MANLTYDANGNLVSDWADTYGWDAQNRLVSINASTAHGIYFAYDSVGRRSAQYQAASNIYSTYLYDGQNKIQEGGTTTVNYLTGGLDENFVRSQGGSNNDYLRDALGSTIGLLDSNAGWVQGYTY
ncbi:MAG TPA: hypothetical protein VN046_00685 [Stenotrophobium sp.]|nr:hypothetical protein [Stenotrophobium sp.]